MLSFVCFFLVLLANPSVCLWSFSQNRTRVSCKSKRDLEIYKTKIVQISLLCCIHIKGARFGLLLTGVYGGPGALYHLQWCVESFCGCCKTCFDAGKAQKQVLLLLGVNSFHKPDRPSVHAMAYWTNTIRSIVSKEQSNKNYMLLYSIYTN